MQAHRRASLWLLAASLLLTSGCTLITALGEDSEDQDGEDMSVTPDMSGIPDMSGPPDMSSPGTLYPTLAACKDKCEDIEGSTDLCVAKGGEYRCEGIEGVHSCARAANLTTEPKNGGVHATLVGSGVALLVQDGDQIEGVRFSDSGDPERLTVPGSLGRVRSLHALDDATLGLIVEADSGAGSAYRLVTVRKTAQPGNLELKERPLLAALRGPMRPLSRCDHRGPRIFAAPYDSENGGSSLRLAAIFCDKGDSVDRWHVGGFISGEPNMLPNQPPPLESSYIGNYASDAAYLSGALRVENGRPASVAALSRIAAALYELRVFVFNPNQPTNMPPVIELNSDSMMPMPRVLSWPPPEQAGACPIDDMVNDQPPVVWFDYSAAPRVFVASVGAAGYAVGAPPTGGDRFIAQQCNQTTERHVMRDGAYAPLSRASALLLERGASGDESLVVELVEMNGEGPVNILRPLPGKYAALRAHGLRTDSGTTLLIGSRQALGTATVNQIFTLSLNAEGRPICD
jgi:hypothetical protein